jgi:hypothetical protein
VLGNAVHRMPQIGEISSGLWILSGFGGHGLNTTAMGGEIIARAIVEGSQLWRLFSPFELVWAGGVLGRAAVQAYYWYFRTRERMGGWLSRRREATRRGEAEVQRSASSARPAPPVGPADAQVNGHESALEEPAKRRRKKSRQRKRADASAPADSAPPAVESAAPVAETQAAPIGKNSASRAD